MKTPDEQSISPSEGKLEETMDALKIEPSLRDWIANDHGFQRMLDFGISKDSYILVCGPGEVRETRMIDLVDVCEDWMNLSGEIYLDEGKDDPEGLQSYRGWVMDLQ